MKTFQFNNLSAMPALAFIAAFIAFALLSLASCGFAHAGLGTFSSEDDGFGSELLLAFLQPGAAAASEAPGSEDPETPVIRRVVQIHAGGRQTCALLNTGAVRCWGLASSGQLGYASTEDIGDNETPASAGDVDLGGIAVQVRTSLTHTCALLDTGAVRCWGAGGKHGYGTTAIIGDNETPASVGDLNLGGDAVASIDADRGVTCALLASQEVRCWGDNATGGLGIGSTDAIGDDPGDLPITQNVDLGGASVAEVASGSSAGFGFNCARLTSGAVRCWGRNSGGQLGYENTTSLGGSPGDLPLTQNVDVTGGAFSVVQLALGSGHSCALLDTGAVRCWGEGFLGQLGTGSSFPVGDDASPGMPPVDVNLGGAEATQIAAGAEHTCALLASGAIRCWGRNANGQLGYGNTDNIGDNPGELPLATDVNPGGTAVQITAGDFHTCALLDTDAVRCWGNSFNGELGYGNTDAIGDQPGEMPPPDVQVLDP